MKNLIFLFVIIVFSNIDLFSQVDIDVFNQFIGEWEATYEVGGYKNTETIINKWILNDKYFETEINGYMTDDPDRKYSTFTFFTIDDNDKIIGWTFSDNGYMDFLKYKGYTEGKKVIIKGKAKDFTLNHTLELKEGKIVDRREIKVKNNEPITLDVVYVKKK